MTLIGFGRGPLGRSVAALTLTSFFLTSLTERSAFAQSAAVSPPQIQVAPAIARTAESSGDAPRATGVDQSAPTEATPSQTAVTGGAPNASTQLPALSTESPVAETASATPVATSTETPSTPGTPRALPTGADKSGVTSQAISVPKGEGTVKGMGESFSAQLSTGIATLSIPLALPAARGGAQPSLSLSYSSSGGFDVAGVGFSLGTQFIARQTDRGTPEYDDRATWHPEQDRFVFSGGQELVPVCVVGDANFGCTTQRLAPGEVLPQWVVTGDQYFRPRVEGGFQRFFWLKSRRTWRVQDKSGVTMEFGVPLDAPQYTRGIETDPDEGAALATTTRIHRWHLVRTYDPHGNANPATGTPAPVNVIVYRYFQDGGTSYLSDIYDTPPPSEAATAPLQRYAHHTRLVYERRTDPTVSYRSGWRVDQEYRLQRVDVAAKAFDNGTTSARQVARRYHLLYDTRYHPSLLTQLAVEGRCSSMPTEADRSGQCATGSGCDPVQCPPGQPCELVAGSECSRLPPMQFGYSHVDGAPILGGYEPFDTTVRSLDPSPKHSIDEALTDLFDVNADGLPDVIVTAPGLFEGKHGVFINGLSSSANSSDPLKLGLLPGTLGIDNALVPQVDANVLSLSNANVSPLDLDADGTVDLVHMPRVKKYEIFSPRCTGRDCNWVGRPIETATQQDPKIDFTNDAFRIRVLDVDGDGLVDVVATTGTEMQTFFSLGRYPGGEGQFGQAHWTGPSGANLSLEPVTSCLPWSATPIQFSDPDVRIGEMNGDGLPDIVRVRSGEIRYWPGRGNGFWGTGRRDDCPSGSFGQDRHVAMSQSPNFSVVQGDSLLLDDVNGDGLDDLVEVRFNAVDVYLNVDGVGWTKREVLTDTPPKPEFANRVRLVDVDGSGTRDILWGNGYNYKYIDLQGGNRAWKAGQHGGTRPWLLTSVDNGLGRTSELRYSTSTAEMLTADAAGRPWATRMPTVTHVLKRLTHSDNLTVAGRPPGRFVTEYSYRDPFYDGLQREFRGFRLGEVSQLGDSNSPTDVTETTFLLGECKREGTAPDPCTERWRDNPREALKGLPVVTERRDTRGTYASTEHHGYRLQQLHAGLDGRVVRHAFESARDLFSYDTGPFVPGSAIQPLTTVTLQDRLGPATTDTETQVTLRSTSRSARVRTRFEVDIFGNRVRSLADGCIGGEACPEPDELITTVTEPIRPPGDPTGWMWRTGRTYVTGEAARGGQHGVLRNESTTTYNAQGNPLITSVVLSGTLPLQRSHQNPARQVAPPPSDVASDSTIPARVREYDGTGNLTRETGPNARCRTVTYDPLYSQLPTSETTFAGTVGANGCGSVALITGAAYDRGFQVLTLTIDPQGQPSMMEYDEFTRLTRVIRPNPHSATASGYLGRPGLSALPSVEIEYLLPPQIGPSARYSVMHTRAQDAADHNQNGYIESWTYSDGFGRTILTLTEADPSAGDDGAYVASELSEYDAKSAVRRRYHAFFVSPGDPARFDFSATPSAPFGRQRYDAFERQVQTFDLDGTVTLQSTYHALSVDLSDAADLANGPHQGTPATERKDGHGRTIGVTERYHRGAVVEARETRTRYLPSGEPEVLTRLRFNSGVTVGRAAPPAESTANERIVRWMRRDSLGRVVLNVEPNTSSGFSPTVLGPQDPIPSTLKAWRYAYNRSGDLVGTTDARGCGVNYQYDTAGRLLLEDYSPCLDTHDLYSAPVLGPGAPTGIEALYHYDSAPAQPYTGVDRPPQLNVTNQSFLKGRMVAVFDRASASWTNFDGRGRAIQHAVRVAQPGTPQNSLANRYAPRWYYRSVAYDAAERETAATTGATVNAMLGVPLADTPLAGQRSAVTISYSARGTIKRVAGSYNTLIASIDRAPDGLIEQKVYGDAATTTTSSSFDDRRRVRTLQTYRARNPAWDSLPAGYQPPPNPDANNQPTFQLLLQDEDFTYDAVNNPIEIRDWRNADEWPAGAKPVTRKITYDDLYRISRVDYQYSDGDDGWISPFDAENDGSAALQDPRRARPSPHVGFDRRMLWQSYDYDWRGNTRQSDDDTRGFYDRSLGAIGNGNPDDGPYRLLTGDNESTQSPRSGRLAAAYDASGNVTRLDVKRNGAICLPDATARCSQRFAYDWDEVGRLVRGRRWDVTAAEITQITAPLPGSTPAADLRHAYDAGDQRVIKTAGDRHTVYVFDSLELRRAAFAAGDYELSENTEVPYLYGKGVRLARVALEAPDDDEPRLSGARLHVLLFLADQLGSTSGVIDQATGELVERTTFQAYGGSESDYRPERWQAFREDYQFTGKEEDIEVGLQYFGKRFYAPSLQRWMSADPLTVHELGGDLNLYAYVSGQALKAVDPLGLQAEGSGAGAGLKPGKGQTVQNPALPGDPSAKAGTRYGEAPARVVKESAVKPVAAPPPPKTSESFDPIQDLAEKNPDLKLGGAETTLMEDLLIGAAFINQEEPDAIQKNKTGAGGMPGGACETGCLDTGGDAAYLLMTLVGVMTVAGGKAKQGAKKLIHHAVKKISDAAGRAKLRRRLVKEAEAAGTITKGLRDYEAHHIIPLNAGDTDIDALRDKIKDWLGGDINAVDNGVLLPKGSKSKPSGNDRMGVPHEWTYDDSYFAMLKKRFHGVKNADDALRTLREIKAGLSGGHMPP